MHIKRAAVGKTGKKPLRRANPRRRGSVRPRPAGAPLTAFVHVPKTAGTTFIAVLRANFPGAVGSVGNSFKGTGGFDPGPLWRLREAPLERTRGMHVLTGHLPFAIRDVLPEGTRFVTFLRDPVERTISQYYGLMKVGRRAALPGDGSLAAVLAEGNLIYDNLQTRMLSGDPEPLGEVDAEALEKAKENLSRQDMVLGLVERFDESLALMKRELGLHSITYVQQRVMPTRPRGADVPEEVRRLATEINAYDIELYELACGLFEQRIAGQGLEFAADVAAVAVARTGAVPPPPLDADDRAALWDLLVRTRAELFSDRRDRLEEAFAFQEKMRDLLLSLQEEVLELKGALANDQAGANGDRKGRPERIPTEAPEGAPADKRRGQKGDKAGQKGQKGGGAGTAEPADAPPARRSAPRGDKRARLAARAREMAELRDKTAARLGEVDDRICALEASGEGEGTIELDRLRRDAMILGKRLEQLDNRAAQLQARLADPDAAADRADDADDGEDDLDD